jgi:hypothetical protein
LVERMSALVSVLVSGGGPLEGDIVRCESIGKDGEDVEVEAAFGIT